MNRFVAAEPVLHPASPRRPVDAVREVLCDDCAATTVQLHWAELAEPAEPADVAGALGREVIVADRDADLYRPARRADRLTFTLGRRPEPACATFTGNLDRSATADHMTLYTADGGRGSHRHVFAVDGVPAVTAPGDGRYGERAPARTTASTGPAPPRPPVGITASTRPAARGRRPPCRSGTTVRSRAHPWPTTTRSWSVSTSFGPRRTT